MAVPKENLDLEAGRQVGQVDQTGEPCLEKIDQDPFMWHGREAAVDHARRHAVGHGDVSAGQGTLMGVIFPCTANILGVLLFLRLPWIVGKAGIMQGFLLVLVCCSCTFITTLSLSAVATNGKILGGGSYYLISRSLGPAVGAGVGLCFYMANSIGAAMYFMGTVEAWEIAMPNAQIIGVGDVNNIRVTALCLLGCALIFVAGGIKCVSRLGTVFLFIVLLVIACMYVGCISNGPSLQLFNENFGEAYKAEQKAFPQDTSEHNFISLMALWFPAVTGIMAGSNRSADLKDPAGSIPKGTLISQLSTSVIYLSFVVLFGCVAPRQVLLDDSFFAATSAWPAKEVVMYGVMASTIGAGLTSLVSGTRLLSAIAADKTLPVLSIFAARPGKEPRLALLASGALCACAVAVGRLNAVAPVLTMFFLMCYTCVNLSVTVLQAVHDPNWRPRFRFYHWSVSLLGAILCVWMMFAIDWINAIIAVCFCALIFIYATHNSHQVKWGDGFQGMKFQLAKNILLHIDSTMHTKNWRPQILVLTGASLETEKEEPLVLDEPKLLDFVSQLKEGRGITIVGAVCESSGNTDVLGQGGPFVSTREVSTGEQKLGRTNGADALDSMLHEHQIKGFSKLVHTKHFSEGVSCLAQIVGLGAFQPNCVMNAWPHHWQDPTHGEVAQKRFIHTVQTVVELQKAMLVVKGSSFPERDARLTGTIDIWWIVADGGMLLLLPFLLKKNKVWQGCRVRLFAIAREEDGPESVRSELKAFARDFRLDVEVHVKPIINEDLLRVVSNMTRPDNEGVANALSASEFPGRSISVSLFPTWRRHAVDPEPLALQRVHSGILPIFSQTKLPFPEQPPCCSRQIAKPESMCTDASMPLTPKREGTPKQLPSSWSIPDEREVLPSVATLQSTHAAAPEIHVAPSLEEEELAVAVGLNDIICSESAKAELVVTNLPDMPPGESISGYFELVEELTKGLPRCLLVRGTATEVITAFT